MTVSLVIAFLLAACACPWLARRAPRWGLLDVPSARSSHTRPVARVGGIALFLGIGGAVAWRGTRGSGLLDGAAGWIPYLAPAAACFLIGLADDRWGLRPRIKFPLQVLAAALAVALGLRWGGDGLGPFGAIGFGAVTPALTVLWILAVVTLVNFVDGIDLITAATAVVVLGAAAGGGAGPGEGTLHAAALGAVLGLALWNTTPARVFPGDAGTHLLGFLLATAACAVPGAGEKGGAGASALPWAVASAPLVPGVIDVALGLVGKARRGVPLWQAHNDHLYQRLTKTGWSHAAVALRYGALALAGLLLVRRVAPAWGLGVCAGLSALVLLWHLGTGWRPGARRATRFVEESRGSGDELPARKELPSRPVTRPPR